MLNHLATIMILVLATNRRGNVKLIQTISLVEFTQNQKQNVFHNALLEQTATIILGTVRTVKQFQKHVFSFLLVMKWILALIQIVDAFQAVQIAVDSIQDVPHQILLILIRIMGTATVLNGIINCLGMMPMKFVWLKARINKVKELQSDHQKYRLLTWLGNFGLVQAIMLHKLTQSL